jgi:hypothetical protein
MINLIWDKKHFVSLMLIILTLFTSLTSVLMVYAVPACNASKTPKERANAAVPYGLKKDASLTSNSDADLNASYGKLPLSFTANQGQANSSARFLTQGNGFNLFLTTSEAVLNLSKPVDIDTKSPEHMPVNPTLRSDASQASVQTATLRLKVIGANPASKLEGVDQLPGHSNYFTGNDPAKWHINVPNYPRVIQRNVYSGVDIVYYGKQENLEYDFIVAPGAKPEVITVEFAGAQKMRVGKQGDVVLTTPIGEVRQHRPVVYQEIDGARREIAARIVVKGKHQVGFKVGAYDRTKPLVIDPVLSYSTYFGDKGGAGTRIAVDAAGNAYFIHYESAGSSQTKYSVTKLNASGSAMIYSSHFSSGLQSGTDRRVGTSPEAIAVDAQGNAYITGQTNDTNFPATPGAFQTSKPAGTCAFISKLNSSGALAYSTFLGGGSSGTILGGNESTTAIAVDQLGNAYVMGNTPSTSFPVTAGAYQTTYPPLAPSAAFVTKLNPTGSGLVYSTFLGSSDQSLGSGKAFSVGAMTVDSTGNVYVTGLTDSPNLPVTTNAAQPALKPGSVNRLNAAVNTSAGLVSSGDAFVMKLNAAGSALVYCTYLGGSGHDAARSITADSDGNAYVVGQTNSADFPTTNAFQPTFAGGPYTRSKNQGVSWQAEGNGINSVVVVRLAVDSQNPSTLYAIGSNAVLYKSLDEGDSWSSIVTPQTPVSVFIDSRTSTIFINTENYNVFKSLDGGNTWSGSLLQDSRVSAIDPATSAIYADSGYLSSSGFKSLKSTNGGNSWTQIAVNLDSAHVDAIAPNSPLTLYGVIQTKGVFSVGRSTDGGITWAASNLKGGARTMSVDPQSSSIVYATHENTDAALGNEGRGNARKRSAQSGNPTSIEGYALLKSTDGGLTYNPINAGLQAPPFFIAVDPQTPTTLYAATSKGVYKSTDAGANWVEAFKTHSMVSALAVGPQSTVHIGTLAEYDGFVTKVNPTGTALVYSTYVGAISQDIAKGTAMDSEHNIYIVGETSSTGFPATQDALQPSLQGNTDGFIVKLNPTGNRLYSSFFGGKSNDGIEDIALDSTGNFYITGYTYSANFPLKNALQPNFTGSAGAGSSFGNAFISKFSNSAAAITGKPEITGISMTGKKLIVNGAHFEPGALIVVDGQPQPTNVLDASQLFSKKAGKRLPIGQPVMLQVKNPDGSLSNQMSYTRQPVNF